MKKVVRFVMPQSRQHRVPRARSSVGAARAPAVRWLADWGYVERLEDIRLCVSELAANAVLHGVPPGREFSLEADADGPLLRIGVRDSGGGLPEVAQADVDMCSGRGLRLVVALADDFGVTVHRPGKTVWVAFKAGCPMSVVHQGVGDASRREPEGWAGGGVAAADDSEREVPRSAAPMMRAAASWFLAQQALPRHQTVKLSTGTAGRTWPF
ncbi:ATP-binding protein [Streptomyces antibioticus]|uniref:ATP-binding protein n=1 Tax=Streptomyces antibioticus TaxID=1890 RepID=UPI0033A44979